VFVEVHSDSDDTQRWSWTVECVTCDKWQTATVHKLVMATAVVTWTLPYLHYIIYVHVNWAHNFAFV